MTAPEQDWWLIVRRDGVPHCWQVGDTSDPARTQDLINRARVLVGFPADDGWIGDLRDSVQLTCGRPHDRLMAEATLHRLSDLDAVTAEALAAYRVQSIADQRRAAMGAAREAMLRLTSEERTQVIGELPPRSTGGTR